MRRFEAGDIVRCIETYEDQFTKGFIYVVSEASYFDNLPSRHAMLSFVSDNQGDSHNGWLASKFELATIKSDILKPKNCFKNSEYT